MTTFEDAVLAWIQQNRDDRAAHVDNVKSYGTDWSGSTVDGFRSEFSVTVHYRRSDETPLRYLEVDGEDLGSLWTHVMRSWPEEAGS